MKKAVQKEVVTFPGRWSVRGTLEGAGLEGSVSPFHRREIDPEFFGRMITKLKLQYLATSVRGMILERLTVLGEEVGAREERGRPR